VNISINTDSEGPDLSSQSEYLNTTYWDSGYFLDYNEEANIIANYTGTNMPVVIAYEKWNETIFLSTLHPEFEENGGWNNSTFVVISIVSVVVIVASITMEKVSS
jgi:hypothetical protein